MRRAAISRPPRRSRRRRGAARLATALSALRLVRRVPDEQHLAVAVERRRGLRDDLGERLVGPQPHLEHAPDGVARREHAAEPRRDEQVADHDVGVVREIRQAQAAAVAGADRDRAQAVAVHAHGHRVVGIGDQHGLGRQRPDAHDLADDALRVDQRLADVHAVDEPAVQVEPLPVRVEVDGEDLGDERAAADARRRIEQLAQARVLALERLEPLQPRLGLEPLAPELPVLGDQRVARRERIAAASATALNGRSTATRTG